MVYTVVVREVGVLAYFLKKQKQGKQIYLAIYESFYSADTKGTKHRCHKSLGNIEKLKASGINDPIAYGKELVDELNKTGEKTNEALISKNPVIKHLGYFPLKSLIEKLKVKPLVDLFHLTNDFNYDLFSLITTLIYARCVKPCSKYKTYFEVLPSLFETVDYSYDQLLDGLAFIGNDYTKFIELFFKQYKDAFGSNTSTTYFDCTNFYFEIDKSDDFRREGPSKENRKSPIVGMGLLLDANQVPVWMKLYPGNQSEKPVLREIINELKSRDENIGRTIHVADKGLNCAQNIAFSKENKDGYLFSKSVKTLPKIEKEWVLNDHGWKEVKDSKGNLLYKYKSDVGPYPYTFDRDGEKVTVKLTEKRLVTYNPSLAAKQRREINKMIEKARGLCLSQAKKNQYGESSKFVVFQAYDKKSGEINDDAVGLHINEEKINEALSLAGYNMIVTSETKIDDIKIYNTYHNLWRIEESFRIMKTDLDARPVYVQKEETIKGHFLICYLTVMLERILQFKVYKEEYSSNDLMDFFKDFAVVRTGNEYLNTSVSTDFIHKYSEKTGLPLNHLHISETKLKRILNYKL